MKKLFISIILAICTIFNAFMFTGCNLILSSNSSQSEQQQEIVIDIKVDTALNKTTYSVGDTWSNEGGVLTLVMDNDSEKTIPFTADGVVVTPPDLTTAGTKTVRVEYDGYATTYQITVVVAKYTVTLNPNYEGAVATELKVENNMTATLIPAVREGYRFDGWYTAATGGEVFDATTRITADIQLYAHWTKMFELIFNFNYSNGPAKAIVEVANGETVKTTDIPETNRTGFVFNGWYTAAMGGTAYDLSKGITEDIELFAQWTEVKAEDIVYTVTFDYNYTDAPAATSAQVVENTPLSKPAVDPTRNAYTFDGWFTAPEGGTKYDFTTPVSGDMVLYAQWTLEYYVVTYQYILEGEVKEYTTKNVKPDRITAAAQMPTVEGYVFNVGEWYEDEACTKLFDFKTKINQNYTLYAKAYVKYTFEAEYTYIPDQKEGVGSSNGANGIGLISKDTVGTAGVSGSYFMSSMYLNGCYAEFIIQSDRDVTDALLTLRLSAEWEDMYIAPKDCTVEGVNYYGFEVCSGTVVLDDNGNPVQDFDLGMKYENKIVYEYDPIALEGAIPFGNDYSKRPFDDHIITNKLTLRKGLNVIRLTVTNTHSHDGSMQASAPSIDCIYVQTDAKLTWEPHLENIEKWEQQFGNM